MIVTYDSDLQSSPSNSSSQSQSDPSQQNQSSQTKQSKKTQKRLKNAIAYRIAQQQQNKKFKHIFQYWKDLALLNYRSNIISAIMCYENKIKSKGFDGIMEYAMISTQFKQKIVLFYYRFIIKKYFQSWKQGHRDNILRQQPSQDQQFNAKDTIIQINKSLDNLADFKINSFSSNFLPQSSNSNLNNSLSRDIIKPNEIKKNPIHKNIKKSKPVLSQQAAAFMTEFNRKIQMEKFSFALRSIQSYVSHHKQKNKFVTIPKNQTNFGKFPYQNTQNFDYIKQEESQIKMRNNNTISEGFRGHLNLSRQSNLMMNSRRTQYQNLNDKSLSRSKRKLMPIVQKIELPSFSKRNINYNDDTSIKQVSKNQNYSPKHYITKKISYQKQQSQIKQQIPSKQLQIIRNRKQQEQKTNFIKQNQQKIRKQKIMNEKQQKQKQQLQKRNRKKEQRKNQLLSIITKGKLLELVLINSSIPQEQSFFNSYKKNSQQTLRKIKLI